MKVYAEYDATSTVVTKVELYLGTQTPSSPASNSVTVSVADIPDGVDGLETLLNNFQTFVVTAGVITVSSADRTNRKIVDSAYNSDIPMAFQKVNTTRYLGIL